LGPRDSGNPANLLSASGYCGVGLSTDGGKTWSMQPLPVDEAVSPMAVDRTDDAPICGDPVAGVGPDGTFYAAAAAVGSPSWTQGLTSTDHGVSWHSPTEVFGAARMVEAVPANPGHRTPAIAMGRGWMAVDQNTGEVSINSQEDGGVEGRWLAVSSDHGQTWSTPRPLDPDIQSSSAGAHGAAHGTIAVTYVVDPTSPNYLTSPTPAVTCTQVCTVFETTSDKGVTWVRHVMPVEGEPGRKFVAADPSTPGRFAVLLTSNSDKNMDVWVTPDSGTTWTRKAFTVTAGESFGKPDIAYSPTGALGIVWRTPRGGAIDVLAAVARDGGTTFSNEVTMKSGIPAGGTPLPGDDCACNLHLDATTLSATWADASTGQRQMYYGRFDYTTLP